MAARPARRLSRAEPALKLYLVKFPEPSLGQDFHLGFLSAFLLIKLVI
jgi:hypothetical protein